MRGFPLSHATTIFNQNHFMEGNSYGKGEGQGGQGETQGKGGEDAVQRWEEEGDEEEVSGD